jgi:hypothetical protein
VSSARASQRLALCPAGPSSIPVNAACRDTLTPTATHNLPRQLTTEIAMTNHRRSLTVAGVAGSFLLAACSSSSTPAAVHANTSIQKTLGNSSATGPSTASTGSGGSVAPCSLLTQAEVDAAVGQPLGPGKSTIPNYDCTWATSDFAASVSVTVSDWNAVKTSATTTGTATSVPGVGDEALSKGGGLLYVRKGDAGFLLLIGGPHIDSLPDHGLAAEKVLATAVLGRL